MYISSYLNLFLACTAALMASSPDVHCNAANLRSSSGANPEVEEDLIEGPLDMDEDGTSLWARKHRYHGGRHGYNKHHYGGHYGHKKHHYGYNKHHYGGYKNKHHYGHNKHHYGGYKNKHHYGYKKHHYDDWGYPPQSPWVASAM